MIRALILRQLKPCAVAVVAVVGLVAGCGSSDDECERAAAKLRGCDLSGAREAAQCGTQADRCIARCVLDATCEDIADAMTAGAYETCLADCT